MKPQYITLLILSLLSCTSDKQNRNSVEFYLDDGIYFERLDSTQTSPTRYSEDNGTYKVGDVFVYDYNYFDVAGNRYKFEELEDDANVISHAWRMVDAANPTDETIHKIQLKVLGTNTWWQEHNPDYKQTLMAYRYYKANEQAGMSATTGVVDNSRNIWMHPPRAWLFKILELNPFPFIQSPYEVGQSWHWTLEIGSAWGDARWREWEGTLQNQCEYEIMDKVKLDVNVGTVECYVVHAIATNKLGETRLTSYFNEQLGFVKLDYTNIDSTRLVFELIDFEKASE